MKDKRILLDTNFLIASQIKTHSFYNRTKELRKSFIEDELYLQVPPLILDEFWYVLAGIWRTKHKNTAEGQLNKFLQIATKNILAFRRLQLINSNLDKQNLMNILEYMRIYKLKPRDAMILEIMKKEKITQIASFDSDFASVKGIKVVN